MNLKNKEINITGKNVNPILEFIKRVKLLFVILTFASLIFIFFGIFQPMKIALEKSLIDNFLQASTVSYHSIQNSMQRGIEGAKSISSRSMIRVAITDYNSGKMTLEELMAYSQPKYEDGCKAIDHLVHAQRIVDGTVIASYTHADSPVFSTSVDFDQATIIDPVSKIIYASGYTYQAIISPIFIDNELVGYDQILYNLEEQIESLDTDKILSSLSDSASYNTTISQAELVADTGEMTLYMSSDSYYVTALVQDDIYFVSIQRKESLFTPLSQLVIKIFIISAITYFCYILFEYLYIIRYVKKELHSLEYSRNLFKNMAYIDQLTNAYTRQFLNIWDQTIRPFHNHYTVVMIDIDNFKKINDTYGHETGDKVLKELADTIVAAIRQSDYLIRYGGDEFIIILDEMTAPNAQYLMMRIENELFLSDSFPFKTSISYGASTATANEKFENLLNIADKEMYQIKNQKKGIYEMNI